MLVKNISKEQKLRLNNLNYKMFKDEFKIVHTHTHTHAGQHHTVQNEKGAAHTYVCRIKTTHIRGSTIVFYKRINNSTLSRIVTADTLHDRSRERNRRWGGGSAEKFQTVINVSRTCVSRRRLRYQPLRHPWSRVQVGPAT